jgi:hypothetical protein
VSRLFFYVVDRDFGFAPNPFHGSCTLATCKPGIRASADVNDWVVGMGGGRLNATGRCVFAMLVSEKLTFNDYWNNSLYLDKRPVRNGSSKMTVGDNIYCRDPRSHTWRQADSHHSNSDGSINRHNLLNDTKSDRVLISRHFYYFGKEAPVLPKVLLSRIGYANGRNYRVFEEKTGRIVIDWIEKAFPIGLNRVLGDPFDFDTSHKRYSVETNKVT